MLTVDLNIFLTSPCRRESAPNVLKFNLRPVKLQLLLLPQSDLILFRVNYDRSLSRENTEEIEEAIDVNIDMEDRPEILNTGNFEDDYGDMF